MVSDLIGNSDLSVDIALKGMIGEVYRSKALVRGSQ
jgi:hypothetical protein